MFSGAIIRPARGALAFAAFISPIAIAEELEAVFPNPKSAHGRIAGRRRTCAVSLSEIDTDYGGDGRDRVGAGDGNRDGGGGGSGAGCGGRGGGGGGGNGDGSGDSHGHDRGDGGEFARGGRCYRCGRC